MTVTGDISTVNKKTECVNTDRIRINMGSGEQILLTEKELASLLKLKPQTIRKARHKGTGIPYIKMGHLVRYKIEDVNKWLDSKTRTKTS